MAWHDADTLSLNSARYIFIMIGKIYYYKPFIIVCIRHL